MGNPLMITWLQFGVGLAFLASAVLAFLRLPPMLTWGALALGLGVQWSVWDALGALGVLGSAFNGLGIQTRIFYLPIAFVGFGAFFWVLGFRAREKSEEDVSGSSQGAGDFYETPSGNVPSGDAPPLKEEADPEIAEEAFESEGEVVQGREPSDSFFMDEGTYVAFVAVGFKRIDTFRPPARVRKVPTFAEVKKRYRAGQKEYHPDHFQADAAWVNEEATKRTRTLNLAYAILERKYAEWKLLE